MNVNFISANRFSQDHRQRSPSWRCSGRFMQAELRSFCHSSRSYRSL